jgi:6-phosphogluconolactonase
LAGTATRRSSARSSVSRCWARAACAFSAAPGRPGRRGRPCSSRAPPTSSPERRAGTGSTASRRWSRRYSITFRTLRASGPNVAPRNLDNDIWAADIHLTPDEKLLYITERTSSTLAGFRVDTATGKLTYVGSTPTEKQPRGFAIDSRGKFLVASGEKSETISVYAIDPVSGTLRLLNKYPVGKGANWVEIVSFD